MAGVSRASDAVVSGEDGVVSVNGNAAVRAPTAAGAGTTLAFLAAATALGAAAQLLAEIPLLLNLTTHTGIWVTLTVLAGRAATAGQPLSPGTVARAAVNGFVVLLTSVLVFYATRTIQWDGALNWHLLAFWGALAVPTGPALGALGCLSRSPGWVGAVVLSLVAGLFAAEAVFVSRFRGDSARWGLVAYDAAAAALVLLLAPVNPRQRWRAVLLSPASVVVGAGVWAAVPWLTDVLQV